jgi:hypothetical protein
MALLRARRGFVLPPAKKGSKRMVVIKGGQLVDSSHPIVKGREHLFMPAEASDPIEQATAGPGEMRATKPKAERKAEEESAAADEPASDEPIGLTTKKLKRS